MRSFECPMWLSIIRRRVRAPSAGHLDRALYYLTVGPVLLDVAGAAATTHSITQARRTLCGVSEAKTNSGEAHSDGNHENKSEQCAPPLHALWDFCFVVFLIKYSRAASRGD